MYTQLLRKLLIIDSPIYSVRVCVFVFVYIGLLGKRKR